jgi:hypothetical protein
MIHHIYICVIMVITIIMLTYYYVQEGDYKKEIEKIDKLENRKWRDQRELDMIRAQSLQCPYGDFRSPRSCYFDSGYACTWNDLAQRCDAKY